MLSAQQYWNTIGFKKDFADPFYLGMLSPFLPKNSKIIEYGCGYGRIMQMLIAHGYDNVTGFDFSQNIIERGKKMDPSLDLRLLEEPGIIPCENESVDAVVMSTVLCTMINLYEQVKLIDEIFRVLKNKGIIYLSDFLICDDPIYKEKYAKGYKTYGEWGMYTTSENLAVRHLNARSIFQLLKNFDVQWFQQFNFETMNHHPARTFHCVAIKQQPSLHLSFGK